MFTRLFLLAMFTILQEIASFGLGIDWGSEYHKSTMLLPKGGFRMVENHVSARKTPSSLSFCAEDRFFENQALVKFTKAACQSFSMSNRFNHLLGQNITDLQSAHTELFFDPQMPLSDEIGFVFATNAKIIKDFSRNNASYVKQYDEFPAHFIRYEEVLAMMLENERSNAMKTGDFEWKNAVFTIPDNSMSIRARKTLASAIRLAGLTPSAFVHENSAAMVYSAMDRPASSTPTPEENVLVVNIGSLATKLSLVKVESIPDGNRDDNSTQYHPSVTVLKDSYNTSFSGHLLDKCLADYALQKQIKSMKRVVAKEELSLFKMRRLFTEIKKAKETLSANKEILFNVEDFFEDRSLSVKLSRTDFEENCEHVFSTFEGILVDFLFSIEKEKISRTEIIGGVVRVPKIQEILRNKFKLVLSQTINGDEGAAYGAAFMAANNTAGIKMKKIFLNDGPNYPVQLLIEFPNGDSESKSTEIFPMKSNTGTKKKISIKKLKGNALVTLMVPLPGDYKVSYNISGVEKGLNKYIDRNVTDWKVIFNFQLDPLGIPKLVNSELILKVESLESKNQTVTRVNETDGTNYTETVLETIPKVTNYTFKLTVDVTYDSYQSLSEHRELFAESKSLLQKISQKENEKKNLAFLKNKLESFIYRLKSEATEPEDSKYLNVTETEKSLAKSVEIDFLLFEGDALNITKENIEVLTMEAESLSQIISYRRVEHRERSRVYDLWSQFLKNSTEAIEQIRTERPWTPAEKLSELSELLKTNQEEIELLYQNQTQMGLNEDPVFRTYEISAKVKNISAKINKVGKIAKPKSVANVTENIDDLLKETMKKMKFNLTGDDLTDEQIEELLKNYKTDPTAGEKSEGEKVGDQENVNENKDEEKRKSEAESDITTDDGTTENIGEIDEENDIEGTEKEIPVNDL